MTADAHVMTFNIRYDNPKDGVNSWEKRKEKVAQIILDHQVDILGIQEALHHQVLDLEKMLLNYDWMGVGRDDGIEKGEYSPIFYNKNKFTEVGSGYFWLSESPMQAGSVGWDAAAPRVATFAKLKDNRTGTVVFVLNTHFDHIGRKAREESVKLILQKLNAYTRKEKFPIIVTGDFNADPTSDIIKSLTNKQNPLHLTDAGATAEVYSGPSWTFHGFGKTPIHDRKVLDYVMVRNNVSILEHHVLFDENEKHFPSDHCPVLVKVEF